jgi:hypothetical protein
LLKYHFQSFNSLYIRFLKIRIIEKEIEIKNHPQKEKLFAALLEKNPNDIVDFILYSSRKEKALKALIQMKLLTFIQHYNRIMRFDQPMEESEMNNELQNLLTESEIPW